MFKILMIFFVLSCNAYKFDNNQVASFHLNISVDTNKRYVNMINYIKNDTIIKEIIYPYYPLIECFDFPQIALPDTVIRPITFANIDYYMFITNDTNKSIRYKYDLIKKFDSINLNKYKNKKYIVEYTNFIKNDTCTSTYDFGVFFNERNVWSISILPKVIRPGLWRMVSYIFVFDENDNISRIKTSFAQE